MERVQGFGGYFFHAEDPELLMVNFRVGDLDKIIAQLEAAGIKTEEVYLQDGIGRFTFGALTLLAREPINGW